MSRTIAGILAFGVLLALYGCANSEGDIRRIADESVATALALFPTTTPQPTASATPTPTLHPLANVEPLDEHYSIYRGYMATYSQTLIDYLFPSVQADYLTRGADPTKPNNFDRDLTFREFLQDASEVVEPSEILDRLRSVGELLERPREGLTPGQQYTIDLLANDNQLTFELAVKPFIAQGPALFRPAAEDFLQREFDRFMFESSGQSFLHYLTLPDTPFAKLGD